MSLREALANAVLHGNRQDPRKKVRVCCACEAARGILIVVKDEGEGFNRKKFRVRWRVRTSALSMGVGSIS